MASTSKAGPRLSDDLLNEISLAVERGKAVADMLSTVLEEDGVVVPGVFHLTPASASHTIIHYFEAIEKMIREGHGGAS